MIRYVAVFALAGFAFTSGQAGADAAKDDMAAIVGTWKMESGQRGGQDAPAEIKESFRITFAKDGKLVVEVPNRKNEGTFKLDATKKPKEISLLTKEDPREAIYELSGDTLKICLDDRKEGERPTKFESPEGTQIILMVLKRVKEK